MNEVDHIELDFIQPNPWQPREDQDPEAIEKLAQSIQTDGLMQIPTARVMPDSTVQLAFGHRRFAAFQHLLKYDLYSGKKWSSMPLIIRDLSDEEMFRYAVSENVKRQDLTPIEEAKAMIRYRDEFGKTSAEIGELFGLSDATVRGKIRLLKLPAVVQDLIRRRQISEGAARALIGMYDLPEYELQAAEDVDGEVKPSDILEIAVSGAAPQQISLQVERLIDRIRPRVKQITLPEIQNVSTETVEPPDEYFTPPQYQEEVEEIPAEVLDEAMPDEEPTPAAAPPPAPAKPLTEAYQKQAAQVQRSTPAPASTPQAPAKPAEPEKHLTWAESTVTLTFTLWPEDGNESGRMVMIGGRVNQDPPVMQTMRMNQLALTNQLAELLANLNKSYQEKN
ncbi:MAG TPA: ParB/RepB/Spo0J family partition protein [Bellilinea sp.]|nr:ParB/RepB/Spo0J family partition protein [Bellilinea sp.]